MPSTAPAPVRNINFICEPRSNGLGTFSSPPVTETTCNLARMRRPLSQRSTTGVVGAYCKRGDRQLELGCTRVTTVKAIMSPQRRMWDVTEGLDR